MGKLVTVVEEALQEGIVFAGLTIADHAQVAASTRDRDVYASLVCQKADFASGIAADKGEDDGLLFTTLEPINRFHLYLGILGVQFSLQ